MSSYVSISLDADEMSALLAFGRDSRPLTLRMDSADCRSWIRLCSALGMEGHFAWSSNSGTTVAYASLGDRLAWKSKSVCDGYFLDPVAMSGDTVVSAAFAATRFLIGNGCSLVVRDMELSVPAFSTVEELELKMSLAGGPEWRTRR